MNLTKSFHVLFICVALIGQTGCGSSEPTAEERAAQDQRSRVDEQQRLVDRVTNFPGQVAGVIIPQLEALTPAHVSDMQGAANVARQFDRAALELSVIKAAQSKGVVAPSPAIASATSKLRAVLVRKQKELYPAMRRTYVAYLSEATAGAQTNFRALGPSGKTLRGASLSFSSQSAVMQAHQAIVVHATQFRFTKAEYVYSFGGERYEVPFHGKPDGAVSFED